MLQTSPGRIPVNRWSCTILATTVGMQGKQASTTESSTGPIGSVSRASVRPFAKPRTARSPCQTSAGARSFSTAQRNIDLEQLVTLLT